MTLTPEQISQGWIEWHGGECPIKDDRTVLQAQWSNGAQEQSPDWSNHHYWTIDDCPNIIAYRIIEAHGADAEPARPTPVTTNPPERIWLHWHEDDRCWAGWHDNPDHAEDGEQEYVRATSKTARPTPFPASYDDLVFDDAGWSQTIIVDGKRPEWLRDDDVVSWTLDHGFYGYVAAKWHHKDTPAIRVRRRKPKRETRRLAIQIGVGFLDIGTIDLIDGKPDLSTLKIAEDAL